VTKDTVIAKDTKAKFDSYLFSLEESSEEPQIERPPSPVKPQPEEIKHTGRKKKIVSSDEEEEMEVGHENVVPNKTPEPSMHNFTKKGPSTMKVKVKKTRHYIDGDGFEVQSDYSEYEEVPIPEKVVDPTKVAKVLDVKKPEYNQPARDQASLTSFYIREHPFPTDDVNLPTDKISSMPYPKPPNPISQIISRLTALQSHASSVIQGIMTDLQPHANSK
jgi:hypothetical protein